VFGLIDPLRDTVPKAVQDCRTASIQVIMCTGDYLDTAKAISKHAGIVTEAELAASEYTAMTGEQFSDAVGGLNLKLQKPNDMG
jgi:Ca2+-transporting ATPase